MPRVVCLSSARGVIGAGPEDDRIRVVDAIGKTPYRDQLTGDYIWRPPYRTARTSTSSPTRSATSFSNVIGPTPNGRLAFERKSHDEAGADLVSLVSLLHFDRVVDAVLERTRSKLFSVNILSQIGEYRVGRSGRRAGRLLFQNKTMRSVAYARRAGDKYVYARPLLGAAFDILVEIYEARLVRRGLIPPELAARSTHATARGHPAIRRAFAAFYEKNPDGFAEALRDATADFARLPARAWDMTRRTGTTFSRVASNIAAADARLNQGRYRPIIQRAFAKRRIAVRVGRP